MNPAEIVVHVMERNGVLQVFQFLGKPVCEARKPTHRHLHRQILASDKACRNVRVIGVALDDCFSCAHAHGWAVARFRRVLWSAVNLLEHCVINLRAKSIFNRTQVSTMAVCRELNLIGESRFQIVHEMEGAAGIAMSDEPARHKLCIGVNRNPRPSITAAFRFLFQRAIPVLGVNERPNFVALNSFAGKISENFVLIFGASTAKIAK